MGHDYLADLEIQIKKLDSVGNLMKSRVDKQLLKEAKKQLLNTLACYKEQLEDEKELSNGNSK